MDYDLLQIRSAQISDEPAVNDPVVRLVNAENRFRRFAMPSLNFSCDGSINGFLIGADIRRTGDGYSRILLLEKNPTDGLISTIDRRDIEINFESNMVADGVYQIFFDSPLEFKTDDFIGYWHQGFRSTVHVYRQTNVSQVIHRVTGMYETVENITGSRILLYPLAGKAF